MQIKKLIGAIAATAVASTMAVAVAAETYNAYIFVQTAPYSFRNKWSDADYGKETEFFNKFIVWGGNDIETFPEHEDKFSDEINGDAGYIFEPTYTDVTIDGDGTYKVGMTDFDWSLDGATGFNLLGVSTDVPYSESVTISDVKVIVDGTEAATYAEGYIDSEEGKKGYVCLLLANIWNSEIESYVGAYPTSSIEIEFTIAGVDAPEAPADPEPEAPTDPEPEAPANPGDSSKPNAGTGAEGLALVAGVAVLAAGAVVVAKKRK